MPMSVNKYLLEKYPTECTRDGFVILCKIVEYHLPLKFELKKIYDRIEKDLGINAFRCERNLRYFIKEILGEPYTVKEFIVINTIEYYEYLDNFNGGKNE